MKLGIALVTMDRPGILRQTLSAIARATAAVSMPIVIVDNGSTDPDTLEILNEEATTQRIQVIRNASNLGLSRAVNQGLAALDALGVDILIHFDDDALIIDEAHALRALEIFQEHPRLGLVVPGASSYPECIEHGGAFREIRWGLG